MSILHTLTEKPWLAKGPVYELRAGREFFLPRVALGLRVFLAVVGVLFTLLVVTYASRMSLGDWHPLPEPWLLWPNTALLILSSIAFQRACGAANRGQIEGVRSALLAAGVLAFGFLAGQLLAWQHLVESGYFAAANPANAFFYLLTALHALHLSGGLVAWARTSAKLRRGFEAAEVRLSVELCTIYWHFLLMIWLVVFGLLLFT